MIIRAKNLLHRRRYLIRKRGLELFCKYAEGHVTACQEFSRRVFALASDMGEPLDRACALSAAVELMAFGLKNTDDQLASSFLVVSEALTEQLANIKTALEQIIAMSARR